MDQPTFGSLRQILVEEFRLRKTKNPSYSLRAFSRDLGLTITTLSQFLNQKRTLSKRSYVQIVRLLQVPFAENDFQKMVNLEAKKTPVFPENRILAQEELPAIEDWLSYAILNISHMPNHQADVDWLARHFAVEPSRVQTILNALLSLQMIGVEDGKIKRLVPFLKTSSDIPVESIRANHKSVMRKVIQSVDEDSVKAREVISTTFAIDSADLPKLKKHLRGFRQQFVNRHGSNNPNAIYNVSFALVPLSKTAQA